MRVHKGDITFGGANKLVSVLTPFISAQLTQGRQELMAEGDPEKLIECGQSATMTLEVCVSC